MILHKKLYLYVCFKYKFVMKKKTKGWILENSKWTNIRLIKALKENKNERSNLYCL